jgi:hypothetical protein
MYNHIIFTFEGDLLPVAYALEREGADVFVCQIEDGKDLGVDSWMAEKEDPEKKRRRLSMYDRMIEKHSLNDTLEWMSEQTRPQDFFVSFGFNSCHKIAEKVRAMGFKGLLHTEADYDRECDRQASKEFVKAHYPGLTVRPVTTIKGVDKVIAFIESSDKIWCIKSEGDHAETIVPNSDDTKIAHELTISQLRTQRADYEKGNLLLEEKIPHATEFTPQMAFWDGKPIYSQVEIETRMLGSGDLGPQTGGNQNVVIRTELDCKLNDIAFPEAARALVKGREGLFLLDAGILAGEDGKLYFTEFAGSRWGWGGIFSELAAADSVTGYFDQIAKGRDPYRFDVGSSIAFHTLKPDLKYPKFNLEDQVIVVTDSIARNIYLQQCKRKKIDEEDRIVNVSYQMFGEKALGYAVGCGYSVKEAVRDAYDSLQGVGMKEFYYRPKFDALSKDYHSSILNRYEFLKDRDLI